jgi:ubiquinone/menaquinone biosynthesis C-methylase UbiE
MASSAFLMVAASWGQTQPAPPPKRTEGHSKKVDPQINAQFQKANVKEFIKRFESEDREVFVKRHEITRTLELKPGMAVADVGAGTGLFTRLIADGVGARGRVFAVDVSKAFLNYIAREAKIRGQTQVETILGTQDSINLPSGSVDLVFLCDVYHHLEKHEMILASIHRALKLQGVLLVVEFDRVEGRSSDFVLKHVRAGQQEIRREIEEAGFQPVALAEAPRLKENFIAKFRKVERDVEKSTPAPARKEGGRDPAHK